MYLTPMLSLCARSARPGFLRRPTTTILQSLTLTTRRSLSSSHSVSSLHLKNNNNNINDHHTNPESMTQAELDAKSWTSHQLSDEDAADLERFLDMEKSGQKLQRMNKAEMKKMLPHRLSHDDPIQRKKNELRGFLEMNPFVCSGCGSAFQSKSPSTPGYLSKEKHAEHRQQAEIIKQQQEAISILDLAGISIESDTAEEILRGANVSPTVIAGIKAIGQRLQGHNKHSSTSSTTRSSTTPAAVSTNPTLAVETETESELQSATAGEEEEATVNASGVCVCQRCFRLQKYGQIDSELRPGWSTNELLTPERFEQLLGSIKESKSVVTCLVDVFDLQGSILRNLKNIAGDNPIVIAVNKIDLLPSDVSHPRLLSWIHSEVQRICGLQSPRVVEASKQEQLVEQGWISKKQSESEYGILRQNNVHLVSCQTGFGMDKLIESLLLLAKTHGEKIHVMGAANVGKSSFINRILGEKSSSGGKHSHRQQQQQHRSLRNAAVTVSNLPGTTLDFLRVRLKSGVTVIDTPGLLNTQQLTARLTPQELKLVIPAKPINAVTLRVSEGKCVMIGGLASVHLVEGKPFFITFFISNEIRLHPTDSSRVAELLLTGLGDSGSGSTVVNVPASVERMQQLGEFQDHHFTVEGDSWKRSSRDIVIAGLGWISVTGPGMCRLRVSAPKGVSVAARSPLLPFEAKHSTASFTGGRLQKKSHKPASVTGGYGWRA